MFWMLIFVSVGAIAYAVSVLTEHNSFVKDMQPRMARLQRHSDNLERTLEMESSEVRGIEAALFDSREMVEALRDEVATVRGELEREI
jgi:predicted  nucleic acid-binding Zn-ribbon protein